MVMCDKEPSNITLRKVTTTRGKKSCSSVDENQCFEERVYSILLPDVTPHHWCRSACVHGVTSFTGQ